jgi:DNA invertase Pin-like site-specific DNA recombinase
MPDKYTAIYARQSLEKKDSLSIEGQIELCKNETSGECKVFEDRGYSGKDTKRPEFEKLMAEVEAGRVSKLVCYRLDRISRSILDFGNIWEALSRNNVEFVSVSEKFDTSTPVGRAMLYIIMVFAQLERETIAERVKDNYYQRVKTGGWPGGPAPYGMRIAEHRVNGSKALDPTAEIDIVKRIFGMYSVTGASLGSVARQLTNDGIPCTKRKSWDTISVFRVLRHPAYVKADTDVYAYYKSKGMIIYNEPEDFNGVYGGLIVGKRLANERKYTDVSDHLFALANHPGIIDSSLFLTCQYKLDGNKQIKNTGKGMLTWLSGLLHCAECGYSLKVLKDRDSGKLRFYCSGRTNFYVCDVRHTETVEEVEAFVENEIVGYIMESLNQQGERKPVLSDDSNAVKLSLYQTEQKISNLVKALAEGSPVTIKYINAELDRLEAEKKALVTKLNDMAVSSAAVPLLIDFPGLDFDDKKAVAAMLIKSVICSPDGTKVLRK